MLLYFTVFYQRLVYTFATIISRFINLVFKIFGPRTLSTEKPFGYRVAHHLSTLQHLVQDWFLIHLNSYFWGWKTTRYLKIAKLSLRVTCRKRWHCCSSDISWVFFQEVSFVLFICRLRTCYVHVLMKLVNFLADVSAIDAKDAI